MVLGCINRTVWGTKLLLTAILASLVDCISLFHMLKAQHCSLSSTQFMILQELKKLYQKPAAFK